MRLLLLAPLLIACGGAHAADERVRLPTTAPATSSGRTSKPQGAANTPPPPARGSILSEVIYGGDAEVDARAIAIDAAGNRWIAGAFRGASARLGTTAPRASADYDAFLVKLDSANAPAWWNVFGGSGADYGDSVVVDRDGAVWFSGAFSSPVIDLGGGPLRCAGVHDLFLVKLDGSGKLLLQKRYGDALDQIDLQLAADPNGGVVATGWYNGTVDFGTGPVANPNVKASFVASLDEKGQARWASAFGHRLDYAGTSAIVLGDKTFVSGGSEGTAEFVRGGAPATKNDLGPVLLELDAKGKRIAAKRFGSGADNLATSLAAAPGGGFRYVVSSRGEVDFGSAAHAKANVAVTTIASFDRDGAVVWAKPIAAVGGGTVSAIAVDANGTTFVVGQTEVPVPGSPWGGTKTNGFVVAIDDKGEMIWKTFIERGGRTWLSGVALEREGRLVVVGAALHDVGGVPARANNGLFVATLVP